jgi:hypothetical protein
MKDDIKKAIELVIKEGKASTSLLQRHLRIGFGKAAGILALLESADVVGVAQGSKPRDVKISKISDLSKRQKELLSQSAKKPARKKNNTKYLNPKSVKMTNEILDALDWTKIIYAEPGGRMGMTGTTVYVLNGDNFILYTTDWYDKTAEPEIDDRVRNELVYDNSDKFYFCQSGFGNAAYIKKDDKLVIADGFFVYDDKYMVDASCVAVFNSVKEKMDGFNTDEIATLIKNNPKINPDEIPTRIAEIKKIYWQRPWNCDDNEIVAKFFLALGSASKKYLEKYLQFSYSQIALTFSNLEKLGVVAKSSKKNCNTSDRKLLISSFQEYEKRAKDPNKSFLEAVDTFSINKKLVKYDLAITEEIGSANEFMDSLHDYCMRTDKKAINQLFASKKKTIKVSKILQAINGKETPWYFSDGEFDLFHSCVTKFMLSCGWFVEFPALLLNVKGIAMLRLDIVKYILANWNWITATYSLDVFDMFARKYGSISLKDSAVEEDAVRREYIRKYLELEIRYMQNSIEERVNMFITNDERHPWFEKSGVEPNADIKLTTLKQSLNEGFTNSNDKE